MKSSIQHLHLICEDWKRELSFFKDEIPILRNRLEEVVSKNSDKDILTQVEHFENKFAILNTHIDELMHDVNLKKDSLNSQAATQVNYTHIKMVESDENMEELMQITAKDFYDTKKDYYRFLSKVM